MDSINYGTTEGRGYLPGLFYLEIGVERYELRAYSSHPQAPPKCTLQDESKGIFTKASRMLPAPGTVALEPWLTPRMPGSTSGALTKASQ